MIYIDTEGTFRPDRVRQIAEAKGVAAEAAMDNIVCARCFLVETTAGTGWLVKGYEHSMKNGLGNGGSYKIDITVLFFFAGGWDSACKRNGGGGAYSMVDRGLEAAF